MSEKGLRASLYFLVAVVALYFLATLLGRAGDSPRAVDAGLAAALEELRAVPPDLFVIEGPSGAIRLEMGGGMWTANGFEADSSAVDRLVRALEVVVVVSVAGTNPANHERFGVTQDSAVAIGTGEGPLVLLGKAGTRFRTAYARLPEGDLVSLIEGDLRSAAARPLADWRNKVVLRADTGAVARVAVTHGTETRLYERQDSVWTVSGDTAEAVTVNNILQELATLRASGFAPEGAAMPEPADRTVVATDMDGNELAAISLAEQEGNYWLSSTGSPYIFEIPTFRANRLAPGAPEEG
ncbi:MAG: DUF4340 domain-containing protein [Gemmatimonadetes bacterium]|nr:DUF4340 domain-containing protein [Gemmatimonadota bacterium]